MTTNPLSKLYRHKSMYLSLPSKGRFYDSGINLSIDGELGVMPMTAKDEIILKSPDGLFNGDSIIEVLKSCVPDIVNPMEIPASDVDPIIIAIRAASDPNLDLEVTCPECKSVHTYQVELSRLISSAKPIPDDNVIILNDGTTVVVRPYSLKNQLDANIKRFYQLKMQEAMNQSEERKEHLLKEAFLKATDISIEIAASCIIKVILTSTDEVIEVDNKEHISDWVRNMDKETYKKVIGKISELSESNIMKSMEVQCSNCNHIHSVVIDLNPVTFFT